eukprot:961672-Amphidinium_carterae.1
MAGCNASSMGLSSSGMLVAISATPTASPAHHQSPNTSHHMTKAAQALTWPTQEKRTPSTSLSHIIGTPETPLGPYFRKMVTK